MLRLTLMDEASLRPPAASGRAIAAFFDVDNTLVPGRAIELRFFAHLWRLGEVGLREALRSLGVLLRGIPPLSLHPLRACKAYLEGKDVARIESLAERFVQRRVCPRISEAARAAVARHQAAGHAVVLVTASLDFLVAPLARHLGIATVLAARPERRDGRYTGRLLPPLPYGPGKRELVERLANRAGLDLGYSYAYGDSPGDVETLRRVGHPLVVNPIRGMARIAAREGWRIERWR